MTQGAEGEPEAAERARVRPPSTDEHGGRDGGLAINPAIARLTRWLALVGGALMLVAIGVTLISVVGRYGFSAPVPGDYEIVELVCAVGIFLFFPYTHATSSNIVVEFFTIRLADRQRRVLDLVHDIVFAAIAALLTWRLFLGLEEKYFTGESTALVRLPFWWSYSLAVASLALLCIVCMARIVAGVRALRQ